MKWLDFISLRHEKFTAGMKRQNLNEFLNLELISPHKRTLNTIKFQFHCSEFMKEFNLFSNNNLRLVRFSCLLWFNTWRLRVWCKFFRKNLFTLHEKSMVLQPGINLLSRWFWAVKHWMTSHLLNASFDFQYLSLCLVHILTS